MRKFLDGLYLGSGIVAAGFLAGIALMMLAQVIGRELNVQVAGAEDLTAWFCAASAFLALAHTFKRGELIRVGLLVDRLSSRHRRLAELFSLTVAAAFMLYANWAVVRFVYDSWRLGELAQGMLAVPIWIPQLSFAVGMLILLVAIVDELVLVAQGREPTYVLAEQERVARRDFTESV